MQFTHFDGSLTPVRSIGDAISALNAKDESRMSAVTQTEQFMDRRNDVYLPDVTVADDEPLTAWMVDEAPPVAWNETAHGFYREDVTRRYQARILNVFRSKQDGALRVGSVAITGQGSGTITATCVKCKVATTYSDSMYYGDLSYDLPLMQQWVAWIIQHGALHKAKQIDDRIVARVVSSRDDRSQIMCRWMQDC